MQQIIFFFIKFKNLLLFLFLFSIAISLTIQANSYHKSKFVNSANFVSGSLYSLKKDITTYFNLKKENQLLQEENSQLRTQIHRFEKEIFRDTSLLQSPYIYRPAEVINNTYSNTNNYLTLKGGEKQGIKPAMGVITSNGIIGITEQVSPRFSTVLSILNSKSSISVQIKKTGHFGSLVWDGKDPNTLQLIDISRQAPIAQGDSIVTDGRSSIFPKGIPVGKVKSFQLDASGNFYIIQVALFNDMTRTQHVYVIENKNANEIKELESQSYAN